MNGLGIGGNPSLRQGPPNGMRMQPSMIQSQGHLPEMNMNSLHHPPQMRGPNGMIPNVSRGPSHFMGNPQSAQSHPAGMQTSLQFQSMNHTQNPMGASPHVSPPHSAGPMSAPQLNHSNSMPSLQATRHRMTPDNNAVMAAGHHAPSHRLSTINSQFSYMQPHSSPPPNPMGDPSQIAGPSSQPAGAGGNLVNTPAQTLQQQMNPEGYSFAGPSHPQQANALRPHSRLATHPGAMPNQEMQSNPAPHTPAMQQLPRPPSVANRQSPFPERRSGSVQGHRPPSRPSSLHNAQSPQHAAQPRTPRMSQPPSGVQSQPPNASAPSVPRQPSAPPSASAEEQSSSVAPPSFRPSQVPPPRLEPQQIAQAPMSLPRNVPIISLQGLTRMLSFSGSLAADSPQRLQMSYWDSIVNDYFLPRATFKFTLWKDNQRMEAKPFEIGVPILPRFFLVTSQSGVKAMHLTLDNARERPIGAGRTSIECLDAIWTFRYMNGYVVTLRGNLTATMLPVPIAGGQSIPKFEALTFDANHHDKTISLDAIIGNRQVDVTTHPPTPRQAAQTTTTNGTDGSQTQVQPPLEDPLKDEPKVMVDRAIMPAEPVNAFGIPQATMRCLELAESVAQMSDLIYYSKENDLGPLDALKQFALVLRETRSTAMMPLLGDMGSSDIKPAIPLDHNSATNGSSPAYMGTPGQSHPQPPQGSMNGLQMGPP
ncbi:hypothetical protein QCA50_001214 [Cerrena zonata]|uniref:Uncharacterized protein n=1 Tax=Cerrena zonata TaxID=2478898 RepID=A0AAW0H0V0_9APHY